MRTPAYKRRLNVTPNRPIFVQGCGFKNAGQLQVGDTLLPFIAVKNSAVIKVSTSSLGHQLDANCIASTCLWRQGKRRSHDPQSAGAFTKLVIVASFRRVFIARH